MQPTTARNGTRLWSWRRDEKQRQHTRNQLRGSIHSDPVVAECALATLPNRDLERLHAGSVKQVRRVVNAARRRVPFEAPPITKKALGEPRLVARPTWILRERHRPAIFPGVVESEPPPPSLAPVTAILSDLEAILDSGQHSYRALDWLHSVSGLPWSRCAKILKALEGPVDDGAIKMLEAARGFWEQLARFRGVYTSAISLGQIEAAEGDWALVEASELSDWLPHLHVPRMHRRDEFLVRLAPRDEPLLDLDFHAKGYRPLFMVPM